jgi:hypothetical protein
MKKRKYQKNNRGKEVSWGYKALDLSAKEIAFTCKAAGHNNVKFLTESEKKKITRNVTWKIKSEQGLRSSTEELEKNVRASLNWVFQAQLDIYLAKKFPNQLKNRGKWEMFLEKYGIWGPWRAHQTKAKKKGKVK